MVCNSLECQFTSEGANIPADGEAVPAGQESQVADVDKYFDAVYEHLIRQALDVLLHLEGSARVEGPKQEMVVRLCGGSDDAWPLSVTNDLDLATLFAGAADTLPK
jgi:hypothetical protein